MRKYVVYNSDGSIAKWGFSANGDISKKAKPNQQAMLVDKVERGLDKKYKVKNGKLVEKKKGEQI